MISVETAEGGVRNEMIYKALVKLIRTGTAGTLYGAYTVEGHTLHARYTV